jgi:hypothetical protein
VAPGITGENWQLTSVDWAMAVKVLEQALSGPLSVVEPWVAVSSNVTVPDGRLAAYSPFTVVLRAHWSVDDQVVVALPPELSRSAVTGSLVVVAWSTVTVVPPLALAAVPSPPYDAEKSSSEGRLVAPPSPTARLQVAVEPPPATAASATLSQPLGTDGPVKSIVPVGW